MSEIKKFLKIMESETAQDFAMYDHEEKINSIGKQMFQEETVSLDELELPISGNEPFLMFDVKNDIGKPPTEYLASTMKEIEKFETVELKNHFGVDEEVASNISERVDKLNKLGFEEKLTLSAYKRAMDDVIAYIKHSGFTFEHWLDSNRDEVEDAVNDSDEYNRDPYGYHGVSRGDFI